MDKPVIAGKEPILVDVKKGETYAWCSCGKSANQPFCDGSHVGTSLEPLLYTPDKDKKVAFCTCKQTGNEPFCDGAHKNL